MMKAEQTNLILEITIPIMLVFYAILFAVLLHNTVRFIWLNQ